MALNANELQSIIDLIRRDPDARRQLQAALEMEPLVQLPNRVDRLEEKLSELVEIVADLVAAQRRAEARLERVEDRLDRLEQAVQTLVEAHQRAEERLAGVEERLERAEERLAGVEERLARAEERLAGVEERLERLEQTVQALTEAQWRTEEQIQELVGEVRKVSRWQFGEDGRRAGEQYERSVELRASRLLGPGEGGGLQRDHVYRHVQKLTEKLPDVMTLQDEDDPMLADVIWWRETSYAVVEVSVRVDRLDVLRAAQRAETLRRAGVDALGIVIGQEWIADDTETLAQEKAVAWKVGDDVSPGLITFRRQAEK